MSKSFTKLDSPGHEGETNTWFTPQWLLSSLGPFDLDPCTQSFRPFNTATNHICEDLGECGLMAPWRGRVWLNPPYGKQLGVWIKKMDQHHNGVILTFSRTETAWYQEALDMCDAFLLVRGRLSFINSAGKPSTNAGTGSTLFAFGKENVKAISKIPGRLFRNVV